MMKNLLLILLFIVVILGALYAYFALTPRSQSDLPPIVSSLASGDDLSSGEKVETGQSFEESFYQDLSHLFDGETEGYEDIHGEYGFIAS